MLEESFNYKPGYHCEKGTSQNVLTMRLRIEYQGYESRQLHGLLGKMASIPGSDNRIDYIMMRLPKLTDEKVEDEVDDSESIDDSPGFNPAIASMLHSGLAKSSLGAGV